MKKYLIYMVFVLQYLSGFKVYSHNFSFDQNFNNNSLKNESNLNYDIENLIANRGNNYRNFSNHGSFENVSDNKIRNTHDFVFQNNTENLKDNNNSNFTNRTNELINRRALWVNIIICVICSLFILFTVIGNTLVILAVIIVKKLHRKDNYLIVSLAISDVLVGLIVMPFALITEVTDGNKWRFSAFLCDFWTFFDVLLCTASILNLVAISIDRYFIIQHAMKYALKRKDKLLIFMVFLVWLLSGLISMPPVLGFGRASNNLFENKICLVSQDFRYQVYATIFAFYIPLSIMIFLYMKIFKTVKKINKNEAKTCGILIASSNPDETIAMVTTNPSSVSATSADENKKEKKKLSRRLTDFFSELKGSSQSENQKAIYTLGVIMGCFIGCWLPFFTLALIKCIPVGNKLFVRNYTPAWLDSMLLWFGYFNSTLNPIIYARFNKEFRLPFIEILCCRCGGINQKIRDAERNRYS